MVAVSDAIPKLIWPLLPLYYLGRFAARILAPELPGELPPHGLPK